MRGLGKVTRKLEVIFFLPGRQWRFVDERSRCKSLSFTFKYKSNSVNPNHNNCFSSSFGSSSGGHLSSPAPEWIDPFLHVSDVVALSPTNHQQQFQSSPWLSRVIDLLLQHDNGVDVGLENRLDSFCGKFLIKLSPSFVSQVLKSTNFRLELSIRFFRWAGRQRGFPGHNLHAYVFLIQNVASSSSSSSLNTSDSSPHLIVRELLNEIKQRRLSMTLSASTTLIRTLGANGLGMLEEILIVWSLMKESGLEPSVFTYNCLLDALVNSMFLESAEKVFRAMSESVGQDVVSYNTMIKGYCKAGKIHLALELFHAMNNRSNNVIVPPDKITYMTLIQAHYFDGDFDSCFQLYLEMEEKCLDIPVHAYSLVISCLCKSGKPLQAHSVFNNMRKTRGERGNVSIYTGLIDSFAKCGNEDQAIRVFETMKAQGLKPDEVTYGVLISCLCKSGKLVKALEWFRFCQNNSDYSDANTAVFYYTSLIDGFGKAGKVDEAKMLFDEMVANGCVPDAYCYNAIIGAFCKAGNINQAITLFKRMDANGCDQTVYTYTILLDGLFRRHKNEEALKLWGTMIDKGITPTPAAFRTLSSGLCLSGKVERACRILDEMAPMGVIPDTAYQDMVNVLCRAGRIHQACKLADEIVDKGRETPARVRTIFINALRKAGNAELAIKLLHSKIGIGYDRYGSIKRRVRFMTLSSKAEI